MNLFGHRRSSIASPASFGNVYEHNRLSVLRYVYGLTGGPQEEAEDLAAETFLRAWKARHRYEGEAESVIGWLIQIAKRLVFDNYRRSHPLATNELPVYQTDSSPEQVANFDEQKRFLFTLVSDLPEEQREILVLRYMLGWRVSDIARHMGMTENHVSVAIHRTLSKLREKWVQYDAGGLYSVLIEEENLP